MRLRVRVECYSGYKAGERPVRFYLGDTEYTVEEVLDQWYGPEATYFRVRAGDQNVYVLRQALSAMEEAWTLEAFRRA